MSRVKRALDGRDAHIATLRMVILLMGGVLAWAMYGWQSAPDRIRVDIPPDLRTGSSKMIGEREVTTVYSYAHYMWQQINNWPASGQVNYQDNIDRFSCFITPEFKQTLQRDYDEKAARQELRRTRGMSAMYGRGFSPKRVFVESRDSWVVYLDTQIKETFDGQTIKDIFVRYPLRIVEADVDPECNPWGLQISSLYDDPKRLEGNDTNDQLAAN